MSRHGLTRPAHDLLQNLLAGLAWDTGLSTEWGRHLRCRDALVAKGLLTVGGEITASGTEMALSERARRERKLDRVLGPVPFAVAALLLTACQTAPEPAQAPPGAPAEARQCLAPHPPFQPLHCPLYGCAGECLDLAPARTWDALQRWLAERCPDAGGRDPSCEVGRGLEAAMRPVFGK